jgi:hypothetical protein
MNPRELVDHIRSGPVELVLDEPLRFRRRTRSNPCDFSDFLQALQASETIRTVEFVPHQGLGITEDEWILLIKTLGRIKDIRRLEFCCRPGSRDFHPFQAIADAVNNASSLFELRITLEYGSFPRDHSGLIALAKALREHTALHQFTWFDFYSLQDVSPDPVLRALLACPFLQCARIMTK